MELLQQYSHKHLCFSQFATAHTIKSALIEYNKPTKYLDSENKKQSKSITYTTCVIDKNQKILEGYFGALGRIRNH